MHEREEPLGQIQVDETVLKRLIRPQDAATLLSCCTKTLGRRQKEHSDLVRRYRIGVGSQGLRYAADEILALRDRLVERRVPERSSSKAAFE